MQSEHALLGDILRELRDIRQEIELFMATLSEDVQAATTALNDRTAALTAAQGSGVSAADQTALEDATAAANAALAAQPAPAAPAAPAAADAADAAPADVPAANAPPPAPA